MKRPSPRTGGLGGSKPPSGGLGAEPLAVCCASRIKSQKSDCKALFYPANCHRTKGSRRPDNRDFCVTDGAKIHKRDRLLVILGGRVAVGGLLVVVEFRGNALRNDGLPQAYIERDIAEGGSGGRKAPRRGFGGGSPNGVLQGRAPQRGGSQRLPWRRTAGGRLPPPQTTTPVPRYLSGYAHFSTA
jgi:hypothetical protein